jgi:hypothetical protein
MPTGDLDTLLEFYKYRPALDSTADSQSNRIHLRHRSFKDESDQGAGVPGRPVLRWPTS